METIKRAGVTANKNEVPSRFFFFWRQEMFDAVYASDLVFLGYGCCSVFLARPVHLSLAVL